MADAQAVIMGGHAGPISAFGTVVNYSVDASNDGMAVFFQCETTDSITHLWFRYGARTGTPPTYRISLQSPNTTGNPDGTVLGGGSPASKTFTPPADTSWDGLGQWIALDNSYTPSLGQFLCMVIEHSSGTIDASNFSSFTRSYTGLKGGSNGFPYPITEAAGTWTKINANPVFAYRTASNRYGTPGVSTHNTNAIGVTTSGHRTGMAFTLPSGFASTYKLKGVYFNGRLGNSSGTAVIKIWDTSGTVIATTDTWDADYTESSGQPVGHRAIFNSLVSLTAGTKYYIGAECTFTGHTFFASGITLTEANDRLCYPFGTNRVYATYNGSTWTETDTILPLIELIFDDITVPSGSGSTIFVCGE